MKSVLVISQVPPPVHGSTMMTQVFLEVLDELDIDWVLVDRRFSKEIGEVGKFSLGKTAATAGLMARLIVALIRRRPAVCVFFVTTSSFSFIVDCSLMLALKIFRIPVVCYVHTVGYAELAARGRTWNRLVQWMLDSARMIVVLGASLISDVERFTRSDIEVIGNTLPEAPPDFVYETDVEQRNEVLFLSNLIPGKGHDVFLGLAERLLTLGVSARFVLAGGGAPETEIEVMQRIANSDYGSCLQYMGAVRDQEKWRLFAAARALVFPSSKNESFGLVLAEALACGVPVVAYRSGALAPVIEAAQAGIVVDSGDVRGLEYALRSLLSDDCAAAKMGSAGRSLYEREYSRSTFRARWKVLLASLGVG